MQIYVCDFDDCDDSCVYWKCEHELMPNEKNLKKHHPNMSKSIRMIRIEQNQKKNWINTKHWHETIVNQTMNTIMNNAHLSRHTLCKHSCCAAVKSTKRVVIIFVAAHHSLHFSYKYFWFLFCFVPTSFIYISCFFICCLDDDHNNNNMLKCWLVNEKCVFALAHSH